MVLATIRLFPSREQRRHVLSALRLVLGPARAQEQCLSSRVFEEEGYDGSVLYMELWDSEEGLRHHIKSELYNRILAAMELSKSAPEVRFFYVKEMKGMDLVEAVRNARSK